jgi:CHAD domain-containing protein
MRVTARRLRSALQGLRGVLDHDATAQVVEDLRWLGSELSPARDAEVTAAHFDAAVHALPDADILGPVATQINRRFAREQARGKQRAVAALDGRRYLELQERLDTLLAAPPLTTRKRDLLDRQLLKDVRKAYRRTAKRLKQPSREGSSSPHGASAAPARAHDDALHEARKAAKRLRYVLEAVEPVYGKKAATLRKRVKATASLLGDHHDTVTARPVLRELAAQAHQDGGNGFTFGVLYAQEQAAADQYEARLHQAWKKVAKARL